MSKGIVKKALQLVETEDEDTVVKEVKTKKKLTTNKYGLNKERVKLKKNAKEAKERGKVMQQGIKKRPSALEEFRRRQNDDNDQRILKNQEKLSKIKLDKNLAHNILKTMGKYEDRRSKQLANKKDDQPFFTEEDFQKYVRTLV